MAGEAEIQVSRLLDEGGLSSFQIGLMIWSILLSLIDGYDIGAIAFAAPHLVAAWGIPRGSLGPVLSATNIGVLFGSAILGWVGDRYGRKPALISANLMFGVLHLRGRLFTRPDAIVLVAADCRDRDRRRHPQSGGDLRQIGAAKLARDAADRRRRMRAVGRCHPGVISAFLVPHYGWPILFQIGGIVPVVIALAAIVSLPELIKYMALHERQRPRMEKLIAALRPGSHRAGECALRHRGRAAVAVVQSGLSVPQRSLADHAADLAPVRAQPDGLFFLVRLDADAADRGEPAAGDRGARGRGYFNSAAPSAR